MKNTTRKVYLAGSARTPIGKFGGALKSLSAADLGAISATASLNRAGVAPEAIEETFFGCGRQAGGGPNVARQIAYRCAIPVNRPATTINMACASSLHTIIAATRAISLGDIDCALVGGAESMSNVPHLIFGARWGIPPGRSELVDAMYHDGFHCKLCDMLMGATADKLAQVKSVTRQQQDTFALRSQQKAERAQKDGLFAEEIVPVTISSRKAEKVIDSDEHPRPGSTLEGLAKLKPVFAGDGTVTAGNACGITDGAASMLLLSEAKANQLGVTPEAEVIDYAQSGVEPDLMGLGPVPATKKALEKAEVSLDEIDLIELNEAFAAQVLADLTESPFAESQLDDRLNVNGGAIALGHPIGATGARIVTTLLHALKQREKKLGLATLCVSGGQGTAILLRRVS